MTGTEDTTWYTRIPKVELHLHLEGAIPHATLWELIQKYGGDQSVDDIGELENKFNYRDFPHFIETWIWKNQFLREYEDFELIAAAVAGDLCRQNIRYAEIFYSPTDFSHQGLKTQRISESIRRGLDQVKDIQVNLVVDFCRNNGPESAARVLEEINQVKDLGIIGVTIGGSEEKYPPEPFADVYAKARQYGFHTSAHAGEAAGSESIWGAIKSLKVERIGHGTRAFEDRSLVTYLAEHKIPLEVCPISNVKTRVVDSLSEHPLKVYYDKGIPITINTDDPKMFGNSLVEEYRALETELGFKRHEIQEMILQGIRVSWMSEEQKQDMEKSFRKDPDWQE